MARLSVIVAQLLIVVAHSVGTMSIAFQTKYLINLTPHAIHVYDEETGSKVALELESRGELRVRSAPQTRLGSMDAVQVIKGQRMISLDTESPGCVSSTRPQRLTIIPYCR
jgi:hypothetical protein